jgi:hypothetical protein
MWDPSRRQRIKLRVRVDRGPAASTDENGKRMTPPLVGWLVGAVERRKERAGERE